MEMNDQLPTPTALPPGTENPWYPLDRKLGELQSQSGHGGKEKNYQPPLGIEPWTSSL
jgi:hypothetical protein